jgi:hypothetical protein
MEPSGLALERLAGWVLVAVGSMPELMAAALLKGESLVVEQ